MMTHEHALKNGTVLNNYIIIKILGAGGFGITYLAKDKQLGMEVVIKEYFPSDLAIRKEDSTIISKSSNTENDFKKGMQRFEEEAQTLAKFNHPSIVKILGYFEANNTAYFVMEYEEGIDLSQYMKQKSESFSQDEILTIIMPILEGLKEVHSHHYLHRDIKPGNILLRTNKPPVLIDFGASKLAIGEASKSITSMLTEGYAPLEQYNTDIKQQGAFTDVYAIAAVIYKMITGEIPPSAQTRSYNLLQDGKDTFKPLSKMKLTGYVTNFLKAIDRALSIKAKDRPQDVQEFQADIAGTLRHSQTKNIGKYISVIILIILLIFISYFYMQQSNDEHSKETAKPIIKKVIDTSQEELIKTKKELEELKHKNEEEVKQRIVEKKRVEEKRKEQDYSLAKEMDSRREALIEKMKKIYKEQELKRVEGLKLAEKLENERLEKENKKFPLTIKVTPSDARVQILNIRPKYYDGIKLKRGKHKIRVSKKGYKTVDLVVDPSDDKKNNVILTKIAKTNKSELSIKEMKKQKREIVRLSSRKISKTLPQRIDKYTVLTKVEGRDTVLIYTFKINIGSKSEEAVKKEDRTRMRRAATSGICKSAKRFLDAQISIRYRYVSDRSKAELFRFTVRKENCH